MKVSDHVIERMHQRGLKPKDIHDTVKYGIKMVNKHDSSRWTFKHKYMDLYAVTDGDMTILITAFTPEGK